MVIKNFPLYVFKEQLNTNPPKNSGCISILNSIDHVQQDFELNPEWKNSLRLIFDDIDSPSSGEILFNPSHAQKIINEFLNTSLLVKEEFENIFIHCTMGVSRSAAISLFLNQLKNGTLIVDLNRYSLSLYNKHVYNILVSTYDMYADQRNLPIYFERLRT